MYWLYDPSIAKNERDIYIYTVGYIMTLVDIMIQHDTTYPIDCDVRHIWSHNDEDEFHNLEAVLPRPLSL
jgi:hypothetical protein